MYAIYRIKNKIDGKSYIGYTTKNPPEKRWKEHQCDAKRGSKFYFHKAIRKCGSNNFSFDVLAWGEDPKVGLIIAEPLLIEIFNPEYNTSVGGTGRIGITLSTDHKNKISDKLKGILRGPHSEEHKKKISDALIGICLSVDHKRKISKARLGQKLSRNHRRKLSAAHKGNSLSIEHRQKISAAMKRRGLRDKSKAEETH